MTELKRDVDGVSQRMLTVTLRGLERDGPDGHPLVPSRVDDQLTALGNTPARHHLPAHGLDREHLDDIEQARNQYDARRESSI